MNGHRQQAFYSVFPPEPVPMYYRRRRRNRKKKNDKKKEKKGLLSKVQWAVILTFTWPIYANIINAMYYSTGAVGFKFGEILATSMRSFVLNMIQ